MRDQPNTTLTFSFATEISQLVTLGKFLSGALVLKQRASNRKNGVVFGVVFDMQDLFSVKTRRKLEVMILLVYLDSKRRYSF